MQVFVPVSLVSWTVSYRTFVYVLGIRSSGTLISATAEQWDHIFAVNTRGIFLCYKYAAIQMVKQGRGGRIIGACSVAGMRGKNESFELHLATVLILLPPQPKGISVLTVHQSSLFAG